jgi:predicted Zn-dependent protease
MIHAWKRVSATVLLAALIAIVGCVTNPVTGKKEIMLIPESVEIDMGESTDAAIQSEYGLYTDPELTAYVDRISRRMVPYTHRNKLDYHFAVLDTPIENAFAAPGGYIYVTRGLLAMANTEAEIATVLAHELGHVNARHSARQMSRQLLILGGLIVGSVLSEDIQKVAPFLVVGMQVLFLKFSRDDEYQADSLGVLYSRKAGYSPAQMVPFFQSIQKLEEDAGGGVRPPNFLSTHPLTQKRIDEVKKMLVPMDSEMDIIRDDFLRRMDGLVVGENPRQGYVEGSAFYCPDLKFMFAVPEGWTIQNTPRQVVAAPKDEKAAMILTAETAAKDLQTYQKEQLQRFSDAQVSEIRSGGRRINGLSAFRGSYYVSPKPAEGETVDEAKTNAVDIECIQKDNTIFTFIALTSKGDYPNYGPAIDRTVQSFQRLTDPNRLNVQPMKLKVVQAGQAMALRDFLKERNVSEKRWNRIAFINSVKLEESLAAGQLVKIY